MLMQQAAVTITEVPQFCYLGLIADSFGSTSWEGQDLLITPYSYTVSSFEEKSKKPKRIAAHPAHSLGKDEDNN
jgi:hypothetical protein